MGPHNELARRWHTADYLSLHDKWRRCLSTYVNRMCARAHQNNPSHCAIEPSRRLFIDIPRKEWMVMISIVKRKIKVNECALGEQQCIYRMDNLWLNYNNYGLIKKRYSFVGLFNKFDTILWENVNGNANENKWLVIENAPHFGNPVRTMTNIFSLLSM